MRFRVLPPLAVFAIVASGCGAGSPAEDAAAPSPANSEAPQDSAPAGEQAGASAACDVLPVDDIQTLVGSPSQVERDVARLDDAGYLMCTFLAGSVPSDTEPYVPPEYTLTVLELARTDEEIEAWSQSWGPGPEQTWDRTVAGHDTQVATWASESSDIWHARVRDDDVFGYVQLQIPQGTLDEGGFFTLLETIIVQVPKGPGRWTS